MPKILDIERLRALAVLAVIYHHSQTIRLLISRNYVFESWTGVDLFFVISGFVVAMSFEKVLSSTKEDAKAIIQFLVRRIGRILPIAYIGIGLFGAFAFCFPLARGFGEFSYREILSIVSSNLFFFSNYALGNSSIKFNALSHFWSLCVEEHFYLIYPFARVAIHSPRTRILTLVSLIFVVSGSRLFLSTNDDLTKLHFFTHYRLDQIALGVLLAEITLVRRNILSWVRSTLANSAFLRRLAICWLVVSLATILLFIPTGFIGKDRTFYYHFGISFVGLISFGIVMLASLNLNLLAVPLLDRLVLWIGSRSFSIYVFHTILYLGSEAIITHIPRISGLISESNRSIVHVGLYISLLCVVSETAFRIVESPLRQRIRQWTEHMFEKYDDTLKADDKITMTQENKNQVG